MIEKVLCIYKVNIQQHYNRQSKDRRNKNQQRQFEDILMMFSDSPKKPAGYCE